jgi:nitrate/TMAO reductase-like tetraheme cytochrome c subunit
MIDSNEEPGIGKTIRRLTHFEWLTNRRAVKGREVVLNGVFFLLALILLAAGRGQLVAQPLWSALVLALFGCGYSIACSVFKDANYVYPTLALWTFAFFLVCFDAGVPLRYFPVVATLLMWILWVVLGFLEQNNSGFSTAVYRCIILTTLFFGLWAKFYGAAPDEIAAAAFLLYGFSLAFFHFRRPRLLFAYFAGIYLAIGAFHAALASDVLPWPYYGAAVQPTVLVILLLAVLEHRRDKFAFAKPHYHTGFLLTVTCLFMSLAGGRSLLDQFALMAVSLGVPILLLERVSTIRGPVRFNEETYTKGLYFFSQISLYAAIPLVVIAPLVRLGHAMWACVLLAGFSLYCLHAKGGGLTSEKSSRYLHLSAFFTAVSGAWIVGEIYSARITPDLLGLSVVALIWLAVWLYSKAKKLPDHSAKLADIQATTASALVLVGVFGNNWGSTSWISGLIVFACSLIVLLAERRLLTWVAVGISVSFLVAAFTNLFLVFFAHWIVLGAMAIGCLITTVVSVSLDKKRSSLIFSAIALALAVTAISAALKMPGAERSILLVAISAGVPASLAAFYYREKKLAAVSFSGLMVLVSVAIILWTGRLVTTDRLGAAFLLLVPFLVLGWLISRLWMYAMTTAAALALGLLLIAGHFLGVNWVFMLIAAALGALFLHANSIFGDNLGKSSVAAVGHVMAVMVFIVLYRLVDGAMDWKTSLPLVVTGGTYLSTGRRNPGARSIAYLFFSLILVPIIGASRGSVTQEALLVPAALVPVWAIASLGLRNNVERGNFCRGGALLGLFLCLVGATQTPGGTGILFLICLVGFILIMLIQRERFYVHILLLALAMMGYSWIHQTGTHFTQKLFLYILLVFGIASLAEFLPQVIGYLDRTIPVPFVRLFTWRGALLGALVGVVISVLYLSGFTLAVTEHPVFCKSCHNMEKFFASWQHSSHKDVACVECHYDPGFSAHLGGKIGALSQVVSFVTHRYDAKPHAEVSNAACQRMGCHVTISQNTDVFFEDKVHFDHSIHHDAMVEGRDLPCSVCHHQETQTDHIGITSSTCFLCHFHGNGAAADKTSDCKTCHGPPEGPITIGEETFTHSDFFEGQKDVDCHHCHRTINEGDPHVSTVRCQSCHYMENIVGVDLVAFGELHELHIHDQKVGCFDCHGIIRHGVTTKATDQDAKKCSSCHADMQHSLQARMYLGTAVPELSGDPNVMFAAGISCTHCHDQRTTLTRGGKEFVTHVSTSKNCVSCHGDDYYEELFDLWQEDTRSSMENLEVALSEVRLLYDRIAASGETGGGLEDVLSHLEKAEEYCEIIKQDGSEGVHNAIYVEEIIYAAGKEIEKTRQGLNALVK